MYRAISKILVSLALALGLTLAAGTAASQAATTSTTTAASASTSTSAAANPCTTQHHRVSHAKHAVAKAKRALKKAKHSHNATKIKKAKKRLAKAKRALHKARKALKRCQSAGSGSGSTSGPSLQALCDAGVPQQVCDALAGLAGNLPASSLPIDQFCTAVPQAASFCDAFKGGADVSTLTALLQGLLDTLGLGNLLGTVPLPTGGLPTGGLPTGGLPTGALPALPLP
jgi:hypothetical protein